MVFLQGFKDCSSSGSVSSTRVVFSCLDKVVVFSGCGTAAQIVWRVDKYKTRFRGRNLI